MWVLWHIKLSFFTANKLTSLPIHSLIWLWSESSLLRFTFKENGRSLCSDFEYLPTVHQDDALSKVYTDVRIQNVENLKCNFFDVPPGLCTTIGFRRWKMGPLMLCGVSKPCEWFLWNCFYIFLLTLQRTQWSSLCPGMCVLLLLPIPTRFRFYPPPDTFHAWLNSFTNGYRMMVHDCDRCHSYTHPNWPLVLCCSHVVHDDGEIGANSKTIFPINITPMSAVFTPWRRQLRWTDEQAY